MLLFYDTETTGLPVWKEPSGGDNQPHLCQLSAILTDDHGAEEEMLDLVIRPDGWKWDMEDDAAKTHGITMEHAEKYGVDEPWALDQFLELFDRCDKRFAHNEPFDARLIRIALKRYGKGDFADLIWKDFPRACTCVMATKIVDLPPSPAMKAKNMNRPKAPSLEEAYRFFFNEPLEGAHDGLVDVRACKRIYFEMMERAGP